jgi:hypothetical protein
LLELRDRYPKLDMAKGLIREYLTPPQSPKDCVFSQTTKTISADLKTSIEPCQFGGNPDCGQCGCIASAGLKAIADHKLGGVIPVGAIFRSSLAIGRLVGGKTQARPAAAPAPAGLTQIQPASSRD